MIFASRDPAMGAMLFLHAFNKKMCDGPSRTAQVEGGITRKAATNAARPRRWHGLTSPGMQA
jgi:FAD/FMN-containing dehydrogenase